jgi:hypothetical protein
VTDNTSNEGCQATDKQNPYPGKDIRYSQHWVKQLDDKVTFPLWLKRLGLLFSNPPDPSSYHDRRPTILDEPLLNTKPRPPLKKTRGEGCGQNLGVLICWIWVVHQYEREIKLRSRSPGGNSLQDLWEGTVIHHTTFYVRALDSPYCHDSFSCLCVYFSHRHPAFVSSPQVQLATQQFRVHILL